MRRIAVSCLKGGVGKSTTATNLAAGLAARGERVLCIDADSQGHVAGILGIKADAGLADLLTARVGLGRFWAWRHDSGPELLKQPVDPMELLTEARPRLWVLPGGRELAATERLLSQSLEPMQELAKALAPYDGLFDYAIADTAPGWGVLLVNVLMWAHQVLSPVSLESLSLDGLVDFTMRLSDVREVNSAVSLSWVTPTFYDRRVAQSDQFIAQVRSAYPKQVTDPIRYSVKLSEAPAFQSTVFEYAPRSTGAEDYSRLVARVANG